MSQRRPQRLKTFDYLGKHAYSVTCSTAERLKLFTGPEIVTTIAEQILRTCEERQFEVLAYSFMLDHLHLLLRGRSESSDFKATMALVRRRTALAHRRARGAPLWQDGYYERVLRPSDDVLQVIRYIRENPAKAGLERARSEYPYVWWSERAETRSAPL